MIRYALIYDNDTIITSYKMTSNKFERNVKLKYGTIIF